MNKHRQKTKNNSYFHGLIIGCVLWAACSVVFAGVFKQDHINAQSGSGLILSCGSTSHQKVTTTTYNLSLYVINQSSQTYYPGNNHINGTYFDSRYSVNSGSWSGQTNLKSTSGSNGSVPPGGNVLFGTSYPITVSAGKSYTIAWQIRDVNFNPVLQCVHNFSTPATISTPTTPPPSGGGSTTSPNPAPSAPAPAPVQSPGQPSTSGGSGSSSGSTSNPVSVTKLSKPNKPLYFTAKPNKGSNLITLKWQASSSSGSVKFLLERSLDKKKWEELASDYPSTEFTDMTADFSTTYYYRLFAVDERDIKSDPIYANATSDSFAPNSGVGNDLTLKSEDEKFVAFIPAGSLEEAANCTIIKRTELMSLGDDVKLLAGPYSISCQEEDGQYVSRFAEPISVEYFLGNEVADARTISLQSYEGSASVNTKDTDLYQSVGGIESLKLESVDTAYIIVGQPKQAPFWVALLIGAGVLFGLGFGLVYGMKKYQEYAEIRRTQQLAEDYWHKEHGV